MNIDSFFRCYDERRIILASSSIVIAKNKFATNIQNANQHFAWNLHQSWQTKSPYLNEYDIHMFRMKARINMFTVDLILSGRQKDSFDLFGKPSPFPTLRKFQRNELPALLACTFGENSVSTVNSRLCDRNQRRSLLLQRLIKTNRCGTGAGTRGERSRGVGCRIEG